MAIQRARTRLNTAKAGPRVVVQGGVQSTRGNANIPNAGFKVTPTVQPKSIIGRPWYPNWHPRHPANKTSIPRPNA